MVDASQFFADVESDGEGGAAGGCGILSTELVWNVLSPTWALTGVKVECGCEDMSCTVLVRNEVAMFFFHERWCVMKCHVSSVWFDPEKKADRERPLNGLVVPMMKRFHEKVEFIPRHPTATLHDLNDRTCDLGIVRLEDALYTLCHGKWRLVAANRVMRATDIVWFALIAHPAVYQDPVVQEVAEAFATEAQATGMVFGEVRTFPSAD